MLLTVGVLMFASRHHPTRGENPTEEPEEDGTQESLRDVLGSTPPSRPNTDSAPTQKVPLLVDVMRDRLSILLALLTLAAASAAAVFTGIQAREARFSMDLTKRQFALEQRPWIGALDAKFGQAKLRGGTRPLFGIQVENVGKNPARILSDEIHIDFVSFAQDFNPYAEVRDDPPSSEPMMPPGKELWIAKRPDEPIDPGDLSMLDEGDSVLYVYVNILYQDILTGDKHFTHVCYSVSDYNLSGDPEPCPKFNEFN